MVAFGDDNKTIQVPGLILNSPTQARRFFEAFQRKELKKRYKQEEGLEKIINTTAEYLPVLKEERCVWVQAGS